MLGNIDAQIMSPGEVHWRWIVEALEDLENSQAVQLLRRIPLLEPLFAALDAKDYSALPCSLKFRRDQWAFFLAATGDSFYLREDKRVLASYRVYPKA